MEPETLEHFMTRLDAKKQNLKDKMNSIVDDFFAHIASHITGQISAATQRANSFYQGGVDHDPDDAAADDGSGGGDNLKQEMPSSTTTTRVVGAGNSSSNSVDASQNNDSSSIEAATAVSLASLDTCMERSNRHIQFLFLSACEEVFSEYEASLDIGDNAQLLNMELANQPAEVIFETTDVKRRKRKMGTPSDQALICMDKPPAPTDKPFYCKWPDCFHASKNYYNIAKHVRYRHFYLPITKTAQQELHLDDTRDEFKFVGKLTEDNPVREVIMPTDEEMYRPDYSVRPKYRCKMTGCGRPFKYKSALVQHERTHMGVKPFTCKFGDGCNFSAIKRNTVRRHIRQKHFGLPKTYKKQAALNIVDHRDPDEYIEEDIEKSSLF